jgi:hypothetical protein
MLQCWSTEDQSVKFHLYNCVSLGYDKLLFYERNMIFEINNFCYEQPI